MRPKERNKAEEKGHKAEETPRQEKNKESAREGARKVNTQISYQEMLACGN